MPEQPSVVPSVIENESPVTQISDESAKTANRPKPKKRKAPRKEQKDFVVTPWRPKFSDGVDSTTVRCRDGFSRLRRQCVQLEDGTWVGASELVDAAA